MKKKILFIDDEDTQIEGMIDLFTDKRLNQKFVFNTKQFSMNEGNGSKSSEQQGESVLKFLKESLESEKVDILMVDSFLDKNSSDKSTPLGVVIVNLLLEDEKYEKLVTDKSLTILFTSLYTQNKEYISNENVWRNEYRFTNKPSFHKPPSYRKMCLPSLKGRCPIFVNKTNACPQSECFIQYMLLLGKKEA